MAFWRSVCAAMSLKQFSRRLWYGPRVFVLAVSGDFALSVGDYLVGG